VMVNVPFRADVVHPVVVESHGGLFDPLTLSTVLPLLAIVVTTRPTERPESAYQRARTFGKFLANWVFERFVRTQKV